MIVRDQFIVFNISEIYGVEHYDLNMDPVIGTFIYTTYDSIKK